MLQMPGVQVQLMASSFMDIGYASSRTCSFKCFQATQWACLISPEPVELCFQATQWARLISPESVEFGRFQLFFSVRLGTIRNYRYLT